MSAALIVVLGVALAALLSIVEVQMQRLNARMDHFADEQKTMAVELGRIGQRLDDHIVDHPAPGRRA